jgi:hypothetical protein
MMIDRWSSKDTNLNKEGNLNISDFTEDFILDIINKMSEESLSIGSNEEGLTKMKGDVAVPVETAEEGSGEEEGGGGGVVTHTSPASASNCSTSAFEPAEVSLMTSIGLSVSDVVHQHLLGVMARNVSRHQLMAKCDEIEVGQTTCLGKTQELLLVELASNLHHSSLLCFRVIPKLFIRHIRHINHDFHALNMPFHFRFANN